MAAPAIAPTSFAPRSQKASAGGDMFIVSISRFWREGSTPTSSSNARSAATMRLHATWPGAQCDPPPARPMAISGGRRVLRDLRRREPILFRASRSQAKNLRQIAFSFIALQRRPDARNIAVILVRRLRRTPRRRLDPIPNNRTSRARFTISSLAISRLSPRQFAPESCSASPALLYAARRHTGKFPEPGRFSRYGYDREWR